MSRLAFVACVLLIACGADPQDDLDQAAVRLDVAGISPQASIVKVTVVDEAGDRRDLAPAANGGDLTVYVLDLSPGRFAAQVEVRDEQALLLQCKRAAGMYAGTQVPIGVVLGLEDEGPCPTVAGCLGAPDLAEVCNGEDDDCDGFADQGLGEYMAGVGACTCFVPACASGVLQTCEPGSPSAEVCNGIDDDCDAELPLSERDLDGDGVLRCAPCGASVRCGDCDDTDPDRTPGKTELCDGKDNDCNGLIDDGCI